ncbi:hypothetical protein SynMINOS11_01196 [Synechococcus sp. Minos11]|nr:hypothetical protein SynMINOS11_01196 [Synechococcus sp. Minos11]
MDEAPLPFRRLMVSCFSGLEDLAGSLPINHQAIAKRLLSSRRPERWIGSKQPIHTTDRTSDALGASRAFFLPC